MANLFELYARDFSAFHDVVPERMVDLASKLHLYWSDPKRHAFLIKYHGKLAGFVLVKQGSEIAEDRCAWDMAEFFVLRRYRRGGRWNRGRKANLESASGALGSSSHGSQ